MFVTSLVTDIVKVITAGQRSFANAWNPFQTDEEKDYILDYFFLYREWLIFTVQK